MYSNKLAHTVWDCEYHLVFVPKYRRKIICGKLRREIGQISRTLCKYKVVKIIEACKDHIYMCITYTAEIFSVLNSGILERKKCDNDIWKI